MSLLVAAWLAGAPIPVELGPAWAVFSRAEPGHLREMKVEVGTLGHDRSRDRLDFWLRRTVVTGIDHRAQQTWADTRTCARARPLLASMRDIPVPKFAPVGSSKGPPVVLDGNAYSLRTYSDQGTLTAETNIGTPLADWIDRALMDLDSCWTNLSPQRIR
jgi:hypothetical protein